MAGQRKFEDESVQAPPPGKRSAVESFRREFGAFEDFATLASALSSLRAGESFASDAMVAALAGVTELRFANYKHLVDRVGDVFGDDLKASKWLSLANEDFGGKTPLETAREDDYNLARLEPILVRIEHGIDF